MFSTKRQVQDFGCKTLGIKKQYDVTCAIVDDEPLALSLLELCE